MQMSVGESDSDTVDYRGRGLQSWKFWHSEIANNSVTTQMQQIHLVAMGSKVKKRVKVTQKRPKRQILDMQQSLDI